MGAVSADRTVQALQTLAVQLVLTLVFAVSLLTVSFEASASALAGAAVAVLGNLVVVGLVFRGYSASDPGGLVTRMIGAGMGRLVVVALGFAIIFSQYPDPVVWALFGSFILVHLAPAWWMHRATGLERKR